MTPVQTYNSLIAKGIIKGLEKRNMEGFYCETKEEALKKALEIMEEGASISWGGSVSVSEVGLIDAVKAKGSYKVIDRDVYPRDSAEFQKALEDGMTADYFLMSTNAITHDGQLYNIDGSGNRLSNLIFGPKNVIIIAGVNTITVDLEEAEKRTRNVAAPLNSIRLNRSTPCVTTGKCHDCQSEDCICCQAVITRRSRIKNRIKVIIVNESLGF